MKELKNEVLRDWLLIDFDNIADKLGFIKKSSIVNDELIYKTIRCLDYETTMSENHSVNYIITLIALMWEYTDRKQYNLRKIVVKFLSRIGYPTSAIIVDNHFNQEECGFSSLNSVIDNLLTTLNQEHNNVIVNGHKYLLTQFQMNIWKAMETEKVIGISAPTSAGKSFVILLKLLDKLCYANFDIVYIVPTLSLLSQVAHDFNKAIKRLGIKNCKVSNTFIEHNDDNQNYIFVMTQEKTIGAFNDTNHAFSRFMILVVDEIQNIERIKEYNDERAKVLYDTLNEFRYKDNVLQIIISGPRIDDIAKTGEDIFGLETINLTTIDSPVLNLTYSILKAKDGFYLKQYCCLTKSPITKKIQNFEMISGYGKKLYDDSFIMYLNTLLDGLKGQQNIIFAPTSNTAREIACSLKQNYCCTENRIIELIDYYKNTVHPDYSLNTPLSKGTVYHHGKLPGHVRCTIEHAIRNKWVNNVLCTTTLLQGVNLPAQNIIIRNPHLYIRKYRNTAELTNYEMANLRGRAGRLLKDFIGRTFVLDETSFANTDGYDQVDLFDDVTKELPSGYGDRYEKYKEEIEQALITDKPADNSMEGFGDLVSYIRQSVLRYGSNSEQRMKNVGIALTQKQVAAIIMKLQELSVPKEVCYKNRYWDPYVLDVIYNKYKDAVPNHPLERGAKSKLDKILRFLRDTKETSSMYSKYIPAKLKEGKDRKSLVDLCMLWSKETALSSILSQTIANNSNIADEIERIINILQKVVSYDVPLLIKPIFDIKNPESTFLSCMQSGAHNIVSKKLIELGVPRECAIELNNTFFSQHDFNDMSNEEIENQIRKIINNSISKMPYWLQVQLDFLQ